MNYRFMNEFYDEIKQTCDCMSNLPLNELKRFINEYDEKFDEDSIRLFLDQDQQLFQEYHDYIIISPDIANKYPMHYTGEKVHWAFIHNLSPKDCSHCEWYTPREVFELKYGEGITLGRLKYADMVFASQSKLLYSLGITDEFLKFHNQEDIFEVAVCLDKLIETDASTNMIGCGASGIVVTLNDKTYKISKNIKTEADLLGRLKNPQNVVRPVGEINYLHALELEYIGPFNLEQQLTKDSFSTDEVFNIGLGVLNGMIELRSAGILHHRDLRPANIVMHQDTNSPIIIDLGIATTDNKKAKDNRRFGSPSYWEANDLISLGQILYTLSTKKRLFSKSKTMQRTTILDNEKDHRDFIYEDVKRLKYYFKKVDVTIKDSRLCSIIKSLLDPKFMPYEYAFMLMEEEFNKEF